MGLADVRTNAGTLLADSPAFRTLVGAATRAAALLKIHWFGPPAAAGDAYTPAEYLALLPYAVVAPNGYRLSWSAVGQNEESGRVPILIEQAVANLGAADDEDSTVLIAWETHVDAIMDELASLSHTQPATGNYLADVTPELSPNSFGRTEFRRRLSETDLVGVEIVLSFGPGGAGE